MRQARCEDGYVLFGIVILIIILGVSMGAAVPLWEKVVQREREQELIWRGYQYMQAIELYQKKYPGAYPPTMEVLVEQKFLRKEYPDPMTESGEWRVLRQMSPELQMGGQQQAAARAAGITDANRSQAQMRSPGGRRLPGTSRQGQPTGGQFQSSIGRGLGDAALGGIVGVASSSDEETFYEVPGKTTYRDWLFVFGLQQAPAATPAGAAAAATAGANAFGGLPPRPGRIFGPAAAPGAVPGQGGPGAKQQPPGMGGGPGQPGNLPPGPGTQPQQRQPQRPQPRRQP
ncbi:MAG TPA: hypothetical protein VEK15_28530 [Vicinamibacteria bacterium]|nr:hypothetical protein [Vicinamibacteria bacterium]